MKILNHKSVKFSQFLRNFTITNKFYKKQFSSIYKFEQIIYKNNQQLMEEVTISGKNITELDHKELCLFCFDVLVDHLNKGKSNIDAKFPENFKNKAFPLFVTWTIGKDKDLRGCIGTFASEKLEKNLKKYALISALKDTRFSPISLNELNQLHVAVSLLTQFEDAEHPLDWSVGVHGIEIDFQHRQSDYGATFLPEVAEEQGWDQKTTLKYLIKKAGYSGNLETIMEKIKTKRYQSVKAHLSYEEYKISRQEVSGKLI